MKNYLSLILLVSSASAAEIPEFTCKAKIFYMDAQSTGSPTLEVLLEPAVKGHPELQEARVGKLRFTANALFAMPENKPEVLLAISIFTNAKQETILFKARNDSDELFEKGASHLIAHYGKDETLLLDCTLNRSR